MNTTLKVVLGFVAGAAIGGLTTYFYTRNYFQSIADEQIENMREYYLEHPPVKTEKKPDGDNSESKPRAKEDHAIYPDGDRNYEAMATRYHSRYENPSMDELVSRITQNVDEEGNVIAENLNPEDRKKEPYVIQEESYGAFGSLFSQECLTYWADGVLTVSDTDEILDIGSTIGLDAVEQLIEGEDDWIFVRNESISMEYEVEREKGTYKAFVAQELDEPEEPPIQPIQKRARNKYEDD